jgi:hypothetical protein
MTIVTGIRRIDQGWRSGSKIAHSVIVKLALAVGKRLQFLTICNFVESCQSVFSTWCLTASQVKIQEWIHKWKLFIFYCLASEVTYQAFRNILLIGQLYLMGEVCITQETLEAAYHDL